MKKNDLLKQKEDIAIVEQYYSERERLRRNRNKRETNQIHETVEIRENERIQALKKQRSFGEFSLNIKKSLLAETMVALFEGSLPNDIKRNSYNKAIGIGLINEYIEQTGVENILTKVKYNSLFLSEMNRLVNVYHKIITESVDKDDQDFIFDPIHKDKFFEDIKGDDFDELCDITRMRVSDAVEEFIQSNINNKLDIEEVISHTKSKIDSAGYGTDEEVKQEYANIAKRRINEIKNRKYGVLEAVVQKVSKSAMTNESLKESFINENGKFDMDKIVESSTAIYTFLEMMNTTKILSVDENYIKNFLENLK